jgi:hypothetical protein
VSKRTTVVLPAPFGPNSTVTEPGGISRSSPSTARVSPKVRTTARAEITVSTRGFSADPTAG